MREQCVILRLAEAQELPFGSSHAASLCYVTMLFSHSSSHSLAPPPLRFLSLLALLFFLFFAYLHMQKVAVCSLLDAVEGILES